MNAQNIATEVTMTKELATRQHTATPSVERLDELVQWVIAAPVEEVCWRLTELGSMRDWLKTQKQATELRIRAVRLEMVALRKVGLGGLAHKISGSQLRPVANWLATLTDEEFAHCLRELDADKTPIALYRADRAEREQMREALSREEVEKWRFSHSQGLRDSVVRASAATLLAEIVEVGEPFTVADAADRLAERLGLDVEVREATSEGLREMVRSAIRRGEQVVKFDHWSDLPVAFTVMTVDGAYQRVPATAAQVGHLFAHAHEIRQRAAAAEAQADRLDELCAQIKDAVGDVDDEYMTLLLGPVLDGIKRHQGWTDKHVANAA